MRETIVVNPNVDGEAALRELISKVDDLACDIERNIATEKHLMERNKQLEAANRELQTKIEAQALQIEKLAVELASTDQSLKDALAHHAGAVKVVEALRTQIARSRRRPLPRRLFQALREFYHKVRPRSDRSGRGQEARAQIVPELSSLSPDARRIHARLVAARSDTPVEYRAGPPRLAFFSPMPPQKSGISDYSAELLEELDAYYKIDVVCENLKHFSETDVQRFNLIDIQCFEARASSYDRILYHMGNSTFHLHMFALIEKYPGVIVMHDFHLGNILHYSGQYDWMKALIHSQGYAACVEHATNPTQSDLVFKHPANLSILEAAQGVIVHSESSRLLAQRYYRTEFSNSWAVVPLLRKYPGAIDKRAARRELGIPDDAFVVCSFGFLSMTKLNDLLLRAWLCSTLAADQTCQLIFVGGGSGDDLNALRDVISASDAPDRIKLTRHVEKDIYQAYLAAADVAVQLRTLSRGESSAAVRDCLAHGLATIINAHGAMTDLPSDAVLILPDAVSLHQLADALEKLKCDPDYRKLLGRNGRTFVEEICAPKKAAALYAAAIEDFAENAAAHASLQKLRALADALPDSPSDAAWIERSRSLARSAQNKGLQQLLVDVSVVAERDYRTGIQRAVRAQLLALINEPPPGMRVEPVRLARVGDAWMYVYARDYARRLLGLSDHDLPDEPIDMQSGDALLMPDFHPANVTAASRSGLYEEMRAVGVTIHTIIYDLLPILRPDCFPPDTDATHTEWMRRLARDSDQLICISSACADDVKQWLREYEPDALQRIHVTHAHLGADLKASAPTKGASPHVLEGLTHGVNFLMVGTIEPRKGYDFALSAFELLWSRGHDFKLVVIGNEGWVSLHDSKRQTIPQIVERLDSHPEIGERLLWLKGVTDEELETFYAKASCLIAASEAEGFGLPLIEAAHHKLPLIVRDIPVFREVCGEHVTYFSGEDPEKLAETILAWVAAHECGQHVRPDDMPCLTWRDSAAVLKERLQSFRSARRAIERAKDA